MVGRDLLTLTLTLADITIVGAKLFVFQEVYECLLYLLTPFVLPISFIVRPSFSGYLFAGTFGLYFLNVIIFNELHLRLKNERVKSKCVYLYYMPYKVVLTGVNVASCYWSLYKYATYFAKRHPKIIEDERAVDVVLRMEEDGANASSKDNAGGAGGGRRMTVTAIGSQLHGSVLDPHPESTAPERKMTITTFGAPLTAHPLSPVAETSAFPKSLAGIEQGPAITVGGRNFSFSAPGHRGIGRQNTDTSATSPGHVDDVQTLAQTQPQLSPLTQLQPQASYFPTELPPRPSIASRTSSRISARKSTSSRTSSRRRERSVERFGSRATSAERYSQTQSASTEADFVSPGFEELMDRLAGIEKRLNRRQIERLDLDFEGLESGMSGDGDGAEKDSVELTVLDSSQERGTEAEEADGNRRKRTTSESRSMV